jgi:hypothetical protein
VEIKLWFISLFIEQYKKYLKKTSVPHSFQDCFNETIFRGKYRIYDDSINVLLIAGYVEGIVHFYIHFLFISVLIWSPCRLQPFCYIMSEVSVECHWYTQGPNSCFEIFNIQFDFPVPVLVFDFTFWKDSQNIQSMTDTSKIFLVLKWHVPYYENSISNSFLF